MTRIVPLALACALLGGCYLSHRRGNAEDGGPPPLDAPATLDAPVDAPAIDAPVIVPDIACALVPDETMQATDTPYAAHAPALGWDGEKLGLVVFESDGAIAHPTVSATRLPLDLTSTSALRLAGEESHSWGEAAWDPSVGFAVCWNGDPGGRSRTLFRLRDRAGAELAPRLELDPEGGACEGLARAPDRWGAVWRHGGPEVSMRAGVIDDGGRLVGHVDLDEPVAYPGRGASIAADGDGFVVALPREGEWLEVIRIDREGRVEVRGRVLAPTVTGAAIAVHDDGTLGLAIREGAGEAAGLRFLRLDRDLTPLPGEARLVESRGVRSPRLAAMPDGWAVLWVEQADPTRPATAAALAHLDREGVPREARHTLARGENSDYGGPDLLAHAGGLYVAIARPPGELGHEQAFVTRLDCEAPAPDRCAPQDARPSGDDCASLYGFVWDGARCAPILCGCIGADCDRLAPLEEECLADHAGCF